MLLTRSDIDKARKKARRRLLPYFVDVEDVNLSGEDWHMRFDRNNQTYRMLMNVCWLVVKGLLQTRESGSLRMMDFLDEQQNEPPVREVHPRGTTDVSTQSFPRGAVHQLGARQRLQRYAPRHAHRHNAHTGRTVLIIDAKYYSHTTQQQFDKQSVHSGNPYTDLHLREERAGDSPALTSSIAVSGMLLYAKTDEDVQPDGVYQMSGNQISV